MGISVEVIEGDTMAPVDPVFGVTSNTDYRVVGLIWGLPLFGNHHTYRCPKPQTLYKPPENIVLSRFCYALTCPKLDTLKFRWVSKAD